MSAGVEIEWREMPCEQCGASVAIGTADEPEMLRHWASGILRVLCVDCGERGRNDL